MRTRIAELRWKEVVDVQNGSRFGYVEDLEVDLESGQVRALVLPGRRRLFGLLGPVSYTHLTLPTILLV